MVNRQGERFCNEQVYGATLGHELVEHQGGKAWLILDGTLRRQATFQCLFGKLWAFQALPALAMMWLKAVKAPNAQALAARIGADPAKLQASIASANAAAQGAGEDAFGKSADMRHALQGPLLALDISMGNPLFPLATLSLGGLRVDEDSGQVCGAVIVRDYAPPQPCMHGGRHRPYCDQGGLRDYGRCPECGRTYSAAELFVAHHEQVSVARSASVAG